MQSIPFNVLTRAVYDNEAQAEFCTNVYIREHTSDWMPDYFRWYSQTHVDEKKLDPPEDSSKLSE